MRRRTSGATVCGSGRGGVEDGVELAGLEVGQRVAAREQRLRARDVVGRARKLGERLVGEPDAARLRRVALDDARVGVPLRPAEAV